jgi:hypothetical protein
MLKNRQLIKEDKIMKSGEKDKLEPTGLVPLGTELGPGTVTGVQMLAGERYYFLTKGGAVTYYPAELVERSYVCSLKEQ